MSLPLNQVLCGDCRDIMRDFPDNSIDLVVTDPPYGLSFMGKDWDKTLPPREAFEEIIRVLKPGALAFVMSSPRQDLMARMIMLLENVGFNTSLSFIDWIYKTGFPKAYDVSKGIDKRNERTAQNYRDLGEFIKNRRLELGLVQKDISKHFPSKTGGLTGCVANWELGYNLPTFDQWKILKNILDLDNSFDFLIERSEAERETIGSRKINADKWTAESRKHEGKGTYQIPITEPALSEAKKWDGWKSQTGLKPAHEPILMVNKPFSESTIVDNVLKWDTGAINVDACRIPLNGEPQPTGSAKRVFKSNQYTEDKIYGTNTTTPIMGRFPANLLVSDKALDSGEVTKSRGHTPRRGDTGGLYEGGFGMINRKEQHFRDVGGVSRYFDLDAWAEHHGFLDVPKPDKSERDFGLKGKKHVPKSKLNLSDGSKDMRFDGVVPTSRRNVHPTVKPIKLMAYLIELGCPPDGVVLDPFMGSGTTCIAAKHLVRKYIGIEINTEYYEIAKARINAYPVPLSEFTH